MRTVGVVVEEPASDTSTWMVEAARVIWTVTAPERLWPESEWVMALVTTSLSRRRVSSRVGDGPSNERAQSRASGTDLCVAENDRR